MRTVYICSPYRAKDSAELDRHIDYAQQLTRQALEAGLAPITPHLYMTQCLNEDKPQERAIGMTAGLELMKSCAFVIAGVKYGISEDMKREMETAAALHIPVINAAQLALELEYEQRNAEKLANDYAKLYACHFCRGRHLHTCTGYSCVEPYQRAYEAALRKYSRKNE